MTPDDQVQVLKPAVAVVTGGSRGIGRMLVVECARRGYTVVFSHRGRGDDVAGTIKDAAGFGSVIVSVEADVTNQADVDRLARIARTHGPVHVLINNAGVLLEGPLEATTEHAWNHSFAVHVTGPMYLARALAPSLTETNGSILHVASDGGVAGSVYGAAHDASKAAMIGLSKTLARELAPRVRVNSIAPGAVNTDMWDSVPEEVRARIIAETPLMRVGRSDEIARACLDICSWMSVTGQTIVVDGGRIMH